MKKIKPEMDDWLRPEYKRSDFGEFVRGKYANTKLEFPDLIGLILGCLGENEKIRFLHSTDNCLAVHKLGDWTYELDGANQITLRYWLDDSRNLEEPIANPTSITTPKERTQLQDLLLERIHFLQARVSELNRRD